MSEYQLNYDNISLGKTGSSTKVKGKLTSDDLKTVTGPNDYVQAGYVDEVLEEYFVEAEIGDIYNKSLFYDLTDFDLNGSFSVNDDKIMVPASSAGQLSLKNPSLLDKYELSITYKATSGISSMGLGIGFLSVNNTAPISHYTYLVESGVNVGKIALHSTIDNQTTYSPNSLGYSLGDLINVQLRNRGSLNYTITVSNSTTEQTISYDLNIGTGGTGQAFLHNTAKPTIFRLESSTAYEVTSLKYWSNMLIGGDDADGDSIVQGFNSTLPWVTQLGIQNSGGSGDKTADLLLRLDEIINIIKPKTVYLAIGTNDNDFSVFQSNYISIVDKLESNGIRVVKITPIANNNTDMTAKRNWIVSTYPTSSVDLFTPTKATSGTGLNPAYDSGDGTHPNTSGHTLMADTIRNSGLFTLEEYYLDLSSKFYRDYPTLLEFTNALYAFYSREVVDAAFQNVNDTFLLYVRKDLAEIGSGIEKISAATADNISLLAFNRKVSTGDIYNTNFGAFQFVHFSNSSPSLDKFSLDIYNPNGTISINDAISFIRNGAVRFSFLSGTGTRPVAAQADGTLTIDTGGARLAGGNTFTGVQTFSNGTVQPANTYTNSGFLNTLQSNTLTTNVNTYLPAEGGTLQSNGATGWAQYSSSTYTSGSPLVITAGNTTALANNGSTSITTQLPIGVTSFLNTSTGKILAQNDGDFYNIEVRFKAKSSSPNGRIKVGINIGGAQGVIREKRETLSDGVGVEQLIAIPMMVYSGSTFVANGGAIEVTSLVGDTTIYDVVFVIDRTHKAR